MGMVFIMVVVIDVIVMVVDRWWSLWRGCSLWLVIMVVGRCCGWLSVWLGCCGRIRDCRVGCYGGCRLVGRLVSGGDGREGF